MKEKTKRRLVLVLGSLLIVGSVAAIVLTAPVTDIPSTPRRLVIESTRATTAATTARRDGKVNINTATAGELLAVKGIGETLAARIVDYRTENGPFSSVDDLSKVKGIGKKTLDGIRDQLCV